MKVLIVGAEEIYSLENYYVKYLRQAGVDVYVFPAPRIFYQYYKTPIAKILFRLGMSSIFKSINKSFKQMVIEVQPEIIWIFKGMEIFPSALQWARSRKIKLVNYNPDNPFVFSGRGSGNKNVTDSIVLYDLHFTYNLEVKSKLDKEFKVQTAWLPFGFDISDDLLHQCEEQTEVNEVCFVGNPDKARAEFIVSLAKEGIAMVVYGHRWEKFVEHPLVKLYSPVYGIELWKTLRRYRVQLNLMRIHNLNSHNMRTFEIPGVGGIMIAPHTIEHTVFFEHKKEAFLFKNIEDCVDLIKTVLSLSALQANRIRENARIRSINSGYDYQSRVNCLLPELNEFIS